jgi:hypothetical protein
MSRSRSSRIYPPALHRTVPLRAPIALRAETDRVRTHDQHHRASADAAATRYNALMLEPAAWIVTSSAETIAQIAIAHRHR